MKKRNGFVSNSSSSSFILTKSAIDTLLQEEYKEEFAVQTAQDCARDHVNFYGKYPEYNRDKKTAEVLYNEKYNEIIKNHERDYKTLQNIKNDVTPMDIEEFSGQFRYFHIDYIDAEVKKYKDITPDSKLDDLFNLYEMQTHFDIIEYIDRRFFYMLKKLIDSPKERLKLYRDMYWEEVTIDKIYTYKSTIKAKKHFYFKNDKRRVEKYKKEIATLSSWDFYKKYILKQILENTLGWNMSYKKSDLHFFHKELQNVIKQLNRSLIPLFIKLVDDKMEEMSKEDLFEVEYEDGGGCGILAPLLEQGMYMENIKYIKICNH